MQTTHVKKSLLLLFVLAGLIVKTVPTAQTSSEPAPPQAAGITVSPAVPSDIPAPINLGSAAAFAWQEFIALNWPAVPQTGAVNTRDTPDTSKKFGDPTYSGPLVWHTFRGKVEIFPGTGNPPGYVNNPAASYGYDAPPKYVYSPAAATAPPNSGGVGTPSGQVLPFPPSGPVNPTPWINLDENSEIGVTTMYAGVNPTAPVPGQIILFLAKANRSEYNYVASNKWWNNATGTRQVAINNTQTFITSKEADPPAGSPNLVSFPNGTIEVKAAWRKLTPPEVSSKKFYMTRVRYYRTIPAGSNKNKPGYVSDVFGLVALHIIQKTPSAPYFVYATFSQTDNILDAQGLPVETVDGRVLPPYQNVNPMAPVITAQNATSANPATPSSIQHFSPLTSTTQPKKRLFYVNTPTTPAPPPTTQGKVAVNRRVHNIPQQIISVNQAAHAAIASYNKQQGIASSPWMYYKLINVQYAPYDKPPGVTYQGVPGGPDPSTYYQSNEVVETDYVLQVFSGQFQPQLSPPNAQTNVNNLITDYQLNGTPFKNVGFSGKGYLMGGCMGCHGNAQIAGAGFSFIFARGPVPSPETNDPATSLPKFFKLFGKK
jgi:hypothetical protein